MAELRFNGEKIDAKQGETLLQAARRHGANVLFLCDGRGICQTCECRVISGAGNLNTPSELECAGLGEERQRKGYRLSCQARLAGSGTVSVESRAEELWRRARDLVGGANERGFWDGLQGLAIDSANATVDLLAGVTMASPHAIPQLVKDPPTPRRMADYARDAVRLALRLSRPG